MYTAILTKYLGPTNTKGSRVKAQANGISRTLSWDHSKNARGNHLAAAVALATDECWSGQWVGGSTDSGYVWTNLNSQDGTSGFTVGSRSD